jgi:O-succinylbenzoic acid--CoA ligase
MPVLRAQFTGGNYGHYDGRFVSNQPLPEIKLPAGGTKIASLVHTQISRILERPEGLKWLKQFNVILLGGAAVPRPVVDAILNHHLPVYASYGMTETAALCAFCPPEKIWNDEPLRGYPLPGVKFTEINHHIRIHSPACGLGYWLGEKFSDPYTSGDLGHVNADGSVEIFGRGDRIINSGGEKIDPARIEEILKATGLVQDICVFGVIDAQWGQRVVACVVASEYNSAALKKAVEFLEPAARPKNYIFVEKIPLDARGKFDRLAAEKLLQI